MLCQPAGKNKTTEIGCDSGNYFSFSRIKKCKKNTIFSVDTRKSDVLVL